MKSSIVLGAGLQGVAAAFALAAAGHRATLVDRAPEALTRASLRNEGKIHLGFVYAHDTSDRTAALMLDGALAFAPLMDEWMGAPLPWERLAAMPFSYGILRESIAPAEELLASWTRLQDRYAHRPAGDSYLGRSPERLWWCEAADVGAERVMSERVATVVRTSEMSIDTVEFRRHVCVRLNEADGITRRFNHHVDLVERTSSGFRVSGVDGNGATWSAEADSVVNCLWEGRLAIDRHLGLVPNRPWVHRLKYRVLGTLPAALHAMPSITLMLGRFGDIVNYGDGRMYASWYPACLRGWSGDVDVPASWNQACDGTIAPDERDGVAAGTLAGLDEFVPGFAGATVTSVAAGVIFSWGRTDIDDLESELHARHEIGPQAHDGYITVNTGKLTTAPLFARQIAAMLR